MGSSTQTPPHLQDAHQQEEIQVIQPEGDWWWAGWSILSFIALLLNFLFLVVIVKNRKNRELRSLLTAVLITITVLDILNVLRIVPGIILNLHKYLEFQLVYCSVGVFHAVAVAILLVSLGIYLVCPCKDTPPLYYPESTCSGLHSSCASYIWIGWRSDATAAIVETEQRGCQMGNCSSTLLCRSDKVPATAQMGNRYTCFLARPLP